ncbi:MAG: rRNA maturation RNase YbeY [Chloroflexi bacterium]|nr:rRNA maturation RNase YbeY [Chloroflexota bacterium]
MSIEIQIDEPFRNQIQPERLREAALATLRQQGAEGDVTIIITDDAAVAELNQRYLGQTGPTDVLSFPAISGNDIFVMPPDSSPYLGDIVIAFPYTLRQAHAQHTSLTAELDLLVVHGVLHLLGYDHDTELGKSEMWAIQQQILQSLNHDS